MIDIPIGSVIAWLKSFPSRPDLPDGWAECNGQVITDGSSPLNGQTIPNLNASGGGTQRFLRGSTTSGTTGGTETHTHTSPTVAYTTGATMSVAQSPTNAAGTLPSYYEVVWIMRIK